MSSRFDVVASLSFTWQGEDLALPINHILVIARAPSPTKDALSIGWLQGELLPKNGALEGELSLTQEGRKVVELFRGIGQ